MMKTMQHKRRTGLATGATCGLGGHIARHWRAPGPTS